jgi:uncharacterized membrane protein
LISPAKRSGNHVIVLQAQPQRSSLMIYFLLALAVVIIAMLSFFAGIFYALNYVVAKEAADEVKRIKEGYQAFLERVKKSEMARSTDSTGSL